MLPPADCLVSEEVCCTSLFDIANNILAGLYEAMLECYQPSFCNQGGLIAYVTMGTGDDLVYDALSVSVESMRPSDGTVNRNAMSPMKLLLVTFGVRLIESGWPMAQEENGEIFVPDPVEQNAIARHSYAHGERMYRKLLHMATSGGLVPQGMACSNAVVDQLLPMNPAGGTVGWRTSVTLTLPAMV
jgi:hypothetical protein